MRGTQFCWGHDVGRRQKRATELREGRGKPPTPAEAAKLFRADLKRIWTRSPWHPAATIWLGPRLEAEFIEACRRAGLTPETTAPSVLNTLCWGWRRSRLNHDDVEGWGRAVANARKKLAKIGPPPDGYAYQPPSGRPPTDPRIKVVEHAAGAFEPARTHPVLDRSTSCKLRRRQRAIEQAEPPPGFDPHAFVLEHRDIFGPLLVAHGLDPDGDETRALALAYGLARAEQGRMARTVGPAQKRWHALLRRLAQGGPLNVPPTPMGRLPPVMSRCSGLDPQHAAENAAFLTELMAKVNAPGTR
jgi:hypothetical protein